MLVLPLPPRPQSVSHLGGGRGAALPAHSWGLWKIIAVVYEREGPRRNTSSRTSIAFSFFFLSELGWSHGTPGLYATRLQEKGENCSCLHSNHCDLKENSGFTLIPKAVRSSSQTGPADYRQFPTVAQTWKSLDMIKLPLHRLYFNFQNIFMTNLLASVWKSVSFEVHKGNRIWGH